MKSTLTDYILSSLLLALIVTAALLVSGLASILVMRDLTGEYHVLGDTLVFLLAFGLLCAIAARLLLRYRPLGTGLIPMDDPRFAVWKLYTVLYEFGCGALKPLTVIFLRPLVQILFGARIGRDIALGGKLVDPHLIEIGDEAIIGEGSVVTAHAINSGSIYLDQVVIETRATVGVGAVIYPAVRIGEGATVTANAVVRSGTTIPAGELWGGIPARKLSRKEDQSLKAGD